MRQSHPVHKLNISSDIIDCLLEEFDGVINSKRLRSRIGKISELIDVLWKRNSFSSDQHVSNTIFKYVRTDEQRDVIRNYISILNSNGNVDHSGNVYAKIRQESIRHSTLLPTVTSPNIPGASSGTNLRNSSQNTGDSKRRHETFRIVCDNIDNWRDFGRCFDIKDVELNHIGQDQELRNDIKLITNRILERMEEKHNDQFYAKLCDALVEARRKDIIRDLKKFKLI
ncbi:uncharacterized protein LOC129578715 [Sitodiplosis mosellana]|uniref:uncharacterized protein LOC129578715 n=1 Tax=Sitodiplosis mosellana TaxID=263140 RepID=UPI002443A8B4|nr:uncharacterized protein LOC129578715 [Sitodiplosis mosellana]